MPHTWLRRGRAPRPGDLKAGDGPSAQAYRLTPGLDFTSLNIERQAMVVEHAFLASRGGPAPAPAADYAALSSAWRGRA